jgi:MFS transporter, UMF1 family
MGGPAVTPSKKGSRTVVSWALYDLANTVYYAIVVTWGMAACVRSRYDAPEVFGVAMTVTLLATGLVSPALGARVDRTGRAIPGLTFWTLLCVASTVLLAFVAGQGLVPMIAVFAFSLFAYQAALTFYNALLPAVAPRGKEGSVSGLGTGLGYVGLPVSILAALEIQKRHGVPAAFVVAAVLMTVWTVPLWLYVRDDPSRVRAGSPSRSTWVVLRDAAKDKTLLLFLVANFICADVANTLIVWANDYFQSGEGLDAETAGHLQIALSLTAFLGGIFVGRIADRVAPTLVYAVCAAALCLGLASMVAFPRNPIARGYLIVSGGVGVAAIWTIGRQLVMRLVPPERHGEIFGVYGVTVKVSVLGTFVFGFLSKDRVYTDAILFEACMLAVGVGLLVWLHVRMRRRAA